MNYPAAESNLEHIYRMISGDDFAKAKHVLPGNIKDLPYIRSVSGAQEINQAQELHAILLIGLEFLKTAQGYYHDTGHWGDDLWCAIETGKLALSK